MGLFGALFAGVSGLGSQSNKIGIVSNNISNVNTVGYKQGNAAFNTLVVPSASTGSFAPGGVLGNNRQLVSQQGLVQATTSVTDVAISGGGLFVVNTKADGSGDTLYTRAGSFTQDSSGNFKNAAGFFLQGLKVQTPALSVNPGNLSTVNVNQNATGSSVATSLISIAANFNAKQAALVGAGETATLAGDSVNANNNASQILVPTSGSSGNGLVRGDSFSTTTTNSAGAQSYTFTYGGFDIGRNVVTGAVGDGGYTLTTTSISTGATVASPTTTTTAAITHINLPDHDTTPVVGTGLFAAGTLSVGGHSITISATDTLDDVVTAIQGVLGGTQSLTRSGNPGNYSLTFIDTGSAAQAGFAGVAVSGTTPTYSVVAPVASPSTGQITFNVGSSSEAQKYTVGDTAYISGITGSLASSVNGQNLTIVSVSGSNVTLALPTGVTSATGTGIGGSAIELTNRTYDFAGNMLDASSDTGDFLATSGTSAFSSNARTFSIAVNGTSYTYTYNAAPNTSTGQFNSLSTLVTAINNASNGDLTASLVNHQLYISATNASQGVSFTNGNAAGTGTGSSHLPGIDWIKELDLKDVADATSGSSRFNSLQSLADAVNAATPTSLITATVNNPTGISTMDFNAVDPQATISFSDGNDNFGGSIIRTLGFVNSSNSPLNVSNTLPSMTHAGTGAVGYSTGTFTAKYSSTVSTKDMSSGAVTPQFSKDITIYDALGINHTLSMNVLKLSSNKWAVEITAVPASDVTSSTNDGQIASGIVTFAGDGSLSSITGSLANASITIPWTNGANPSPITFNLGTSGKTDGFTQFAGSSNVSQAIQNGSPTGQLTGVSIDESGFVTASFSNGQTQKLYQIPLAAVNNPNGLSGVSGNAYKQTLDSGEVSLSIAGTNGTGTLAASALEQSNVDLSTQLTDLIVAQQAYGANTRVLTVTSQLLQQLNQIIQ